MSHTVLDVTDLRVGLPSAQGDVDALRDVSFTIARGETVGLVGESGSGKSMTALALMGLLPEGASVSGRVAFEGRDLIGLDDRSMNALRGNRIAMVFQEPMTALNPLHTIGDQVAEPWRVHRGLSRAAARAQALRLLERVHLADAATRLDAFPHQLSGGQRQRVTIAMALACEPQLLIADEPTTALDATIQRETLDLLTGLVAERAMTMLLISHDLGVMADRVSRLLVMYGGTVVESGPTAAVFERRSHPYSKGLFAASPRGVRSRIDGARPRLATIPGRVPTLAEMPAGCPFQPRCAWAIDACGIALPPMVEVTAGHAARCIRLDALQ